MLNLLDMTEKYCIIFKDIQLIQFVNLEKVAKNDQ